MNEDGVALGGDRDEAHEVQVDTSLPIVNYNEAMYSYYCGKSRQQMKADYVGLSKHRLAIWRNEIECSELFKSEVPTVLTTSCPLKPTSASNQFFLEHHDLFFQIISAVHLSKSDPKEVLELKKSGGQPQNINAVKRTSKRQLRLDKDLALAARLDEFEANRNKPTEAMTAIEDIERQPTDIIISEVVESCLVGDSFKSTTTRLAFAAPIAEFLGSSQIVSSKVFKEKKQEVATLKKVKLQKPSSSILEPIHTNMASGTVGLIGEQAIQALELKRQEEEQKAKAANERTVKKGIARDRELVKLDEFIDQLNNDPNFEYQWHGKGSQSLSLGALLPIYKAITNFKLAGYSKLDRDELVRGIKEKLETLRIPQIEDRDTIMESDEDEQSPETYY